MAASELELKIRDMAASANPTDEQIAMVMSEWEAVFSALGITDERSKMDEFDGVMRARVRSGIVSIRAPQSEQALKVMRTRRAPREGKAITTHG